MTPKSKSQVAEYEDLYETAERTLRQIVDREPLGYEERDALIRAAEATKDARKELARARLGPPEMVDGGGC